MIRGAIIATALGALTTLSGCDPEPHSTFIIARVASPDRRFVAVYAQDLSGGPATGVSEDVYVVDHSGFPRLADRVFTNECVDHLRLAWEGSTTLRINYDVGADIHEDTGYGGPQPPWGSRRHTNAHGVKIHLVRRLLPPHGC